MRSMTVTARPTPGPLRGRFQALAPERARLVTALLAALLALLLASPAIDAARADAAQVTVVSPGGAQQTLALDAMAGQEDVVERSYALRSATGEARQTVTGFSIAALIDAAGADPFTFGYLEVQRPAGGAVLLTREQALGKDAFGDGAPVTYTTASGTGFIRPNTGVDDLNASDSFEAPQGITLVLRKGTPLRVEATASTRKTKPGKPVDFTATVEGAGAGERVQVSWYFDDGSSSGGASARHKFAKPGSYDVVVSATTVNDRTGSSAVVTIQVGEPKAGPNRKGGGTNEDAGAPDHGAATGTGGGEGAGMGASSTGAGAPAPTPAPAPPAPRAQPEPRPAPGGDTVTGLLLSGEEVPVVEQPPAPAARTGKLDEGGGEGGLPGVALGFLATTALLGAGALIEARSLLR